MKPHDRDDRNNDHAPRKKSKTETQRRIVVPKSTLKDNRGQVLGMEVLGEQLGGMRLRNANEQLEDCNRRVMSLRGEIKGLGIAYTKITQRLYNLEDSLITKLLPYFDFDKISADATRIQDKELDEIFKRILVLRASLLRHRP